jgi:hypothetical protein
MFTRGHLRKWWNRALRRKILFSALDREDRGYLYLAMKAFDEIRNEKVGMIIVKILAKLKDALKSPFVRRMETYGVEKARSISALAVEWGHNEAEGWAREKGFARFLTALEFNAPSGWGI